MSEKHEYQYLLADYWSSYKGLFLKDPRKIRAEEIYRPTIGEDACTPEEMAAHLQIPVEAVHEAIHYCTHNEEFLRQERNKEMAAWAEFEKETSVTAATGDASLIMNLYVDDHFTDPGLAGVLRKAGHTVVCPADVQRAGASDARHLEYTMLHGLVLITADRQDFWDLHDVVRASQGHHPGILLVRFDNDSTRDMRPKHFVRALAKLEQAGVPVADQLITLNHWR